MVSYKPASLKEALELRAREQVIPYAGGTDLILIDPDGGHAIVMQAAGNKIIAMRAGLSASVGSVQGCP